VKKEKEEEEEEVKKLTGRRDFPSEKMITGMSVLNLRG
jgi:hypothetical protein